MEALLLQPGPLPARALLNSVLHRRLPTGVHLAARIVETEYYHETDPASHSYPGRRTPSNAVMFGPPGLAYIYRSHGIHWCLNCTAAPDGEASGVLIRAVEPLEGVEEMTKRRSRGQKKAIATHKLGSGPGNVGQALGVDISLGGMNMLDDGSELWIEQGEQLPEESIGVSPRIGITRAVDKPWRFFIKDNASVSGPKIVKAAVEVVKKVKVSMKIKTTKLNTVTKVRGPKRRSEESSDATAVEDTIPVPELKRPRRSMRLSSRFFGAEAR
ncbi:DNA-3-methyladenine glycosylase [Calocera viscosa TUFC12733]|uniref:DNA-3-methyladenine glycosylase II n=1 Tax=Calocera viscosa (strain TUFC12733) TaxID=1330018 RepID=A0A167K8G1_CALVF|nr:DNA-3-methyladenine glycosylase [Calocera viscosa TUFC12733]